MLDGLLAAALSPSSHAVAFIIVFSVLLGLVLLVPIMIDLMKQQVTTGLARTVMTLGLITIFGFIVIFVLVERPLRNNSTIVTSGLSIVGAILASVTAFYFGTKAATGVAAAAAALTAPLNPPPLSIDITSPQATKYKKDAALNASYTCNGSNITSCTGTVQGGPSVASGALIPTVALGSQTFVVTAQDAEGTTLIKTVSYEIVA